MAKVAITVGSRVRLTGAFLRNTGQIAGGEGKSRWTVLGIKGRLVQVDEKRSEDDMFTADELAADPSLIYRRILISNLEVCR